MLQLPTGIVALHFSQIAVITDVVAAPVLVDVFVLLFPTGKGFGNGKRFENGTTIRLATPDVVDLGDSRGFNERCDEPSDVFGMDVVANLLPFVAKDSVEFPLQVAFHQVTEEAMKLDAGMVGAG